MHLNIHDWTDREGEQNNSQRSALNDQSSVTHLRGHPCGGWRDSEIQTNEMIRKVKC